MYRWLQQGYNTILWYLPILIYVQKYKRFYMGLKNLGKGKNKFP